MQTLSGEGWRLDYIIKDGKLVGMKFAGRGKYMKGAISTLDQKLKEYQKGRI